MGTELIQARPPRAADAQPSRQSARSTGASGRHKEGGSRRLADSAASSSRTGSKEKAALLTANGRAQSSSLGRRNVGRDKRPQYPIVGKSGNWQRAIVNGRVKMPKLNSDEAKLKELFVSCRNGNFREVRALVTHYPHLLSLTDAHGFSALHHAEISGQPTFLAQLLELYRDPRTFTLKAVTYENEDDLVEDQLKGFGVEGPLGRLGLAGSKPVVRNVGHATLAAAAGLMVGDTLDAISGASMLSQRSPPPVAKDILATLRSGQTTSFGFPVTLDFRGSAIAEILCRDGWTPCHAAAAMGAGPQYRSILAQLLSEQETALEAQDANGCTPKHWLHLQKAAVHGRPLSADHCTARRARQLQRGTLTSERPCSASLKQGGTAVIPANQAFVEQELHLQLPMQGPATSRPVTPAF